MILADHEILELCRTSELLAPYEQQTVRKCHGKKVLSFGPSSYGYDLRMAEDLKLLRFCKNSDGVADPKNADFELEDSPNFVIPANSGALTHSMEYIRMPPDVTGICLGKSTYARIGIIANITPLEAGWHGQLTIELVNTNPFPVKVYPGEGIAQVLFFRGEPCSNAYGKRSGKYDGQTGITKAKL